MSSSSANSRNQYVALTEAAGIIDLRAAGALRLTGADRVAYLNSQITGNVAALATGQACRAGLTTSKGKLIAELVVLARADELFVIVAQGDVTATSQALAKHIIADDVAIENVSDDCRIVSVDGPKSREVVWRLFPEGPLPMDALTFGDTDYQGMPVTVLRHCVTGDRGFWVIARGQDGMRLIYEYIVQAGLGLDALPVSGVALETRRVENGVPRWGADIDDNFPKECRLDALVDYEKGCFLGQETLARMHYRGHPNWLLVGLGVAEGTVPGVTGGAGAGGGSAGTGANDRAPGASLPDLSALAGTELFSPDDAEKTVGRLTSPIFSPVLGGLLSLGYVRYTMAETGTTFRATVDGAPVMFQVVPLPVRGL